jgi:hypothetical protein
MKRIKLVLFGLLLISGWHPQAVLSETITLVNSSGDSVSLEIEENALFLEVLDQIHSYFQEDIFVKGDDQDLEFPPVTSEQITQRIQELDFTISHAGVMLRAKQLNRDYKIPVDKEERKDIAFIVNTLSKESLIDIGRARSTLKRAGSRIDHLHPFRFLMVVFGDEELKAGAHAIRDRGGWIWSGFLDGIMGSLKEEAKNKNLLQFTSDFADHVKIDSELILPSLKDGNWRKFVDILIDEIPRKIDPNRYKM